jgi:predicted outer membrane repeat protein
MTRRQIKRRRRQRAAIGATIGAATLGFTASAEAATFEVDNLTDAAAPGPCVTGTDGDCSLRQAIDQANVAAGDDTIVFKAGLTGSIPVGPQLDVNGTLAVNGPGAGALTLDGGLDQRIFYLDPHATDSFSLSGLTVANGDNGSGGGGIFAPGLSYYDPDIQETVYGPPADVTVTGATFASNSANGGSARGGAIYQSSDVSETRTPQVTIAGSTFSQNTTGDDGGAVFSSGAAAVSDSTFSENSTVVIGDAGALSTSAGATVTGSTFVSNHAQNGDGGAMLAEHGATVSGSTFTSNTADGQGGAMAVSYDTAEIVNSTITGNDAGGQGGGIWSYAYYDGDSLTIDSSTVTGNSAGAVGGVFQRFNNYSSVPDDTVVRNSIVADNTAEQGAADLQVDVSDNPSELHTSFDLLGTEPVATGAGTVVEDVPGSNLLGVDPKLGALQNNGGPTETMLPADDSPVLDKGFGDELASDQRGELRPFDLPAITGNPDGDNADIGAVELQAPASTPGGPGGGAGGGGAGGAAKGTCFGKEPTIMGTAGPDKIQGTPGADVIRGLAGKDTIRGLGGGDLLCGGSDNDKLLGGAGEDTLIGGRGSDRLFGGGGIDLLYAGTPNQKRLVKTNDTCSDASDTKHGC